MFYVVHLTEDTRGFVRVHDRSRIRQVVEQLRDAAQRIADKIDELIRAGGPAPAARAA